MKRYKIFDTTLRDGEQAPGCSMDLREKVEMALALERLGVDVMEAGFAAASKGDAEAIAAVASAVKNSTVASLARSTKADIDAAWEAVKGAAFPRIHTFLATSPTHMQYKLKMSEEQVLDTIRTAVSYAVKHCANVEFSCEDATRSELPFLARAVETAIAAGAKVINLPDTVGYAVPGEMRQMFSYVLEHAKGAETVEFSTHCHNDLGLGVANTLAAMEAGVTQVECTVNGIGERAGNAALEEIVMALHTRRDYYGFDTHVDTTRLYPTSRLLYHILGITAPINKAIVGRNAFAHEAGIHQHGVMANRETYEIMTPESVGLTQNKMVLGKHSGKHAVEDAFKQLGYEFSKEEVSELFVRFKQLCDRKKTISTKDLEALTSYKSGPVKKGYTLDRFSVHSGNAVSASAVVRLSDGEQIIEEVAVGNGPIDAALNAIDKIMPVPEHALVDYTIQTISEGKDAQGEAMLKITCGEEMVTGRGLSTDVVEASVLAYVNGMNKLL
jgi:2-isopropylmalate synthase